MTTMNVSIPDELKAFVDEQVDSGAYGTTSEFIRDLIRRERDRLHLKHLLLDGAASSPGPFADHEYFTTFRERLRD